MTSQHNPGPDAGHDARTAGQQTRQTQEPVLVARNEETPLVQTEARTSAGPLPVRDPQDMGAADSGSADFPSDELRSGSIPRRAALAGMPDRMAA